METTEIKLVRTPEISHKLKLIGANVTARLNDLQLDKLIANTDTVKALKDLRAELNKELATWEGQRKMVKAGIMNPYNEFEVDYKSEISEKYDGAISILKDKIAFVENGIKDDKTAILKEYFNELVNSEGIDFLSYNNLGIEVNLSTTEKAYKEKINEFISKTKDDIALIKTTAFQAEITAEYKKTLNISQSITTVNERKEKEAQEAERIKIEVTRKRIKWANDIGMNYSDMTDAYEYDDQTFIFKKDLENLPKETFDRMMLEFESEIKAKSKIPETEKPIIKAPEVENANTAEKIVFASFKVEGTMSQLRKLGTYMKENNIKYSNI